VGSPILKRLPGFEHLGQHQRIGSTDLDLIDFIGRGERIRTSDPLVPNQVRYQTALRPELMLNSRRRLGEIREPQEALDRIPT
jgi:hypothetical protein